MAPVRSNPAVSLVNNSMFSQDTTIGVQTSLTEGAFVLSHGSFTMHRADALNSVRSVVAVRLMRVVSPVIPVSARDASYTCSVSVDIFASLVTLSATSAWLASSLPGGP